MLYKHAARCRLSHLRFKLSGIAVECLVADWSGHSVTVRVRASARAREWDFLLGKWCQTWILPCVTYKCVLLASQFKSSELLWLNPYRYLLTSGPFSFHNIVSLVEERTQE